MPYAAHRRRSARRLLPAAAVCGLAVALAVTLAGCGGGTTSGGARVDDAWRTSRAPVDRAGLVWASGSQVHLGDGRVVDAGRDVRAYVVAGDGVFFVPADAEDDNATFSGAELWFVAPDGEAAATGVEVDDTGVAVSPDGSALAVLDADYDEGSARMRIFDLAAGKEVVSEDGMDTSGIGDPVDHLLESEVEILGIDDEEVYARVIEGYYAYDLVSGEGREVDGASDAPGYGSDPAESPDGQWRIEKPEAGPDRVVDADGAEVPLEVGTPRWNLAWWADAATAVGTTITGPGRGKRTTPGDTVRLLACTVPAGRCETYDDSAGQRVLFPLRSTVPAITLADGED